MKHQKPDYTDFLANNVITPFYEKRLAALKKLTLDDVLKKKNPYLVKAKNIEIAGDFVKTIVDAFLSSQEEGIFGNLLEGFAIHISHNLYGGFKSAYKSVDLEFEQDGKYYIVGIKSSANWGNSDQVNQMRSNFKKAKAHLREAGMTREIVAVNGCMYGKDANPLKNMRRTKHEGKMIDVEIEADKVYQKLAGQDFWHFISGDDELYQDIIKPIDEQARTRSEAFKAVYTAKINEMTQAFVENYMTADNQIDWIKIIDVVSKRAAPKQESKKQVSRKQAAKKQTKKSKDRIG